jgi:hypothetical protein
MNSTNSDQHQALTAMRVQKVKSHKVRGAVSTATDPVEAAIAIATAMTAIPTVSWINHPAEWIA